MIAMNPFVGVLVFIGVLIFSGGFFLSSQQEEKKNIETPKPMTLSEESVFTSEEQVVEVISDDESNVSPETEVKKEPKAETVETKPIQPVSGFSPASVPFYVTRDTWKFSSLDAFQVPTSKRPPSGHFTDPKNISERAIDPKTLLLVRCKITGTYTDSTSGVIQPVYVTGSGVVVSPEGHILTAAHLLRAPDEMNRYDPIRFWKIDSCEVAPTDGKLTPVNASDYSSTSSFTLAEVVFQPSDDEYNSFKTQDPTNPNNTLYFDGGSDLDFALLQVKNLNLPYVPIIKNHLILNYGDSLIGLGYPGLITNTAQSLERIDGIFNGYTWMQSSSCEEKSTLERCGIRYQTKRYKADYKKLYGAPSELGKYTSYFRGGFSGGPLFYKGYVAGIMIFGKENPYSNIYDLSEVGQWNWVEALSSREIIVTLEKNGITLPTVP